MRPLRIVAFIAAAAVALVAVGLLFGGVALTWAHTTQRDVDGFVLSPSYELSTERYALVSEEIELAEHPGDWWPGDVADLKVTAESASGAATFIGIGPSTSVDAYLSGASYDLVTQLGASNADVRYEGVEGSAVTEAPASQEFWVASTEGTDQQTLAWDPAQGEWTVVIMNADGSADIDVTSRVGLKIPILLAVAIGLLVGGVLLGALAAAVLIWAAHDRRYREEEAQLVPVATGAYPATLEGVLDPNLSRGMWLIKWFLAIPHYVVLFFLWIGFFFVSVFAFFAILFTGKYPRSAFEFNVGVLRWTWRVGFYATSAIGTDVYPPFTLADVDYPARFDVVYPQQLSRGLVLVKWWLLAIPQYLIVGLFTSGLIWWTTNLDGNSALQVGGGLIGLLVLIAGVALLFTGRYPQGLYDLVIGLNRWVYRVIAYASLMTDEYPPFRLDSGGSEPSPPRDGPSGPVLDAPDREPALSG